MQKRSEIEENGDFVRRFGMVRVGYFWVFWRKNALPPSKKQKIDYNQEKFILVHFH